ncbi:Molybdopterin synthase catalytic subunit, partial [Coemansia sp. RSA 1804]
MQKSACCGHHSLPEDYVPKHHRTVDEEYDHFLISPEQLSLDKACGLVRTDAAGAVSTFEGTTRDTFNATFAFVVLSNVGKRVVRLEYEAYESMAKKEWHKIVGEAREKYHILGTVMHHRVGEV